MQRKIILLALLWLTACSAEQVYNTLQQDHQRQCRLLPVWQQAHCLSRHDTPWEEYTAERRALGSQGV
jgi:hypothetical protein